MYAMIYSYCHFKHKLNGRNFQQARKTYISIQLLKQQQKEIMPPSGQYDFTQHICMLLKLPHNIILQYCIYNDRMQ